MKSQATVLQYTLLIMFLIFLLTIFTYVFFQLKYSFQNQLTNLHAYSAENALISSLSLTFPICKNCIANITFRLPQLIKAYPMLTQIYYNEEENVIVFETQNLKIKSKLFNIIDAFEKKDVQANSIAPIRIYFNSSYILMIKNVD